jgi:hypothetical protein
MPRPRLTIELRKLTGWGSQIGWVDVTPVRLIPGLRLKNFPVFQEFDTGAVGVGMLLVPGKLPARSHPAIGF